MHAKECLVPNEKTLHYLLLYAPGIEIVIVTSNCCAFVASLAYILV